MRFLRFSKIGTAIFILVFILSQSLVVLAQEEAVTETPPESPPPASVEVSAEAQEQVESELVVSAEAQKEVAVDLSSELGIEGYDPIVPTDGVLGTLVYPLKELAWDVQETAYDVFASDATHARLVQDHANRELVAAAEVYTDDPEETGAMVSILDEYRDDLAEVQETLPAVKEEDPALAKQLSAEIAEAHLFVAPKVLSTMQETLLVSDPEALPELVAIREETLKAAGTGVVAVADDEAEALSILEVASAAQQLTPFSGLAHAEFLSQSKSQLGEEIPPAMRGIFDEVIKNQLEAVETNFKNLPGTDEVKAESFGRFMSQFPGHGLDRMKVIDQFKSQTDLAPVFIEKCNEIKAKVAENLGAKIKQVAEEEIRKAVSEAMLQVANPNVNDFRILNEFHDLVPDEEIKQVIVQNRDAQINQFLERFGDDATAAQVTSEFKALTDKVASGEVLPDANFFQTLEGLKNQLSPEQQGFIEEMENTGKQQMIDRMQSDTHFAERFSSFNPADMQVFEKFRTEGFGPQFGPPPGFDFEAKFREIERQQAENFGRFLDFQDNPEHVQQIQQDFENFVPQEIRQRFETEYNFDETSFSKHEEFAREKEQFFQQKFDEFGSNLPPGAANFPGQPGFPFPGGPGFPFPGGAGFGSGFGPSPFFQRPHESTETGGAPLPEISCPEGLRAGPFGCEFDFQRIDFKKFAPTFEERASGLPFGDFLKRLSPQAQPCVREKVEQETGVKGPIQPHLKVPQLRLEEIAQQCGEAVTGPQEFDFQGGKRRIDESLLRGTPSGTTCAKGLVWVSDPTQPAGGLCAQEFHSCPQGQIADVLGQCQRAPSLQRQAPAEQERTDLPSRPGEFEQPPSNFTPPAGQFPSFPQFPDSGSFFQPPTGSFPPPESFTPPPDGTFRPPESGTFVPQVYSAQTFPGPLDILLNLLGL